MLIVLRVIARVFLLAIGFIFVAGGGFCVVAGGVSGGVATPVALIGLVSLLLGLALVRKIWRGWKAEGLGKGER